ncbi:O-methyltransferase [Pseudothermotoga hypogea DSM 11164 = NBRC 106472]|uniref:O-methyltransferase n=1 Tax=Pseudothermotoga hypogea DSM 11164 = NBRC 106472 TaxID=1123384 RepID=A0A0X1KTB8_9THEM|nr:MULTISPECIES: class I SAM-dependent methyltransferase [Pseudothermotoga]AJC74524.1 O-methyltransferase [Pseudothermotoga hypogea DSM 11164 = NBRC 106472]MBC7121893.1 class I SAM-dependent methyltransferase [Pseudothermotoga sp.]MDI6863282.1 class I SAM-dependent methyltransferase [Pseudothermotoga sp.]
MIFVTTSHKPTKEQALKAKQLAQELNLPYIPRRSFRDLLEVVGNDYCYVVESDRIVVKYREGSLFFHPSTAKVRMRNVRKGLKDHLIECLQLKGNEWILDTTFGLGAEAILMAGFLKDGKVVGLEASTPIYIVVREGLKNYRDKEDWVNDAMRRIEILNIDYRKYFANCSDDSFDIVYCDPMFENPVYESSSMNPLRPFAVYDTVTDEDIEEMLRVARKRVVLKAHAFDSLFDRIRVDRITGSRKSQVLYGVIEKK